jgi:hypothetical protein
VAAAMIVMATESWSSFVVTRICEHERSTLRNLALLHGP